ncbi:MAG: RHS repeat protein [Candidatus Eremiobacteraeota bacterium]|nr:RHS repeat protein [Candidatus Eremiobacteraeota bacterium]
MSVNSSGSDVALLHTNELRVTKTGSGGSTTHEKWESRWDGGQWQLLFEFDVPSGGSETTSASTTMYLWLNNPPPPGTYRSRRSYYVNGSKQGATVEEGVYEVRGLVAANIGAECPFDPEEAPGTLIADIYALPGSADSYLFSGWSPTGSIAWEFSELENVSGTTSVGTPDSDGKVASIAAAWNGKNAQGETNLGLQQLLLSAIANNSGGGNSYTANLGFTFLYHRKCPCSPETGEVGLTIPVPIGGSYLLGMIYLTYQSFNTCRTPNSFGYGWSSYGSAVVSQTLSGLIYRDEGGRVEKWVEDNGVYTAIRPDNYTQVESLGNPGAPFLLTFKDQTTREFNASGKLTEETDRNGNTTTYTYTMDGDLESISDGRGGLLTYDYGSRTDGQPISIRSGDPQTGRLVQFTYSGSRLASITNPAGEVIEFEYDGDGRLKKMTEVRPDQGDRVIEHTYDEFSGRRRYSEYYGLWREEYWALPWSQYLFLNDSEIVVGPIPEEGKHLLDGRGTYYSWDDLGRTRSIERNRIGLIF